MDIIERMNMLYWMDFVDKFFKERQRINLFVNYKNKKWRFRFHVKKNHSKNDFWKFFRL